MSNASFGYIKAHNKIPLNNTENNNEKAKRTDMEKEHTPSPAVLDPYFFSPFKRGNSKGTDGQENETPIARRRYVGRLKFAFSEGAIKKIISSSPSNAIDPRLALNVGKELGIRKPSRFFAEILERADQRVLSNNGDTNDQIAQENYTYTLNNIDEIKIGIANLLLSKIELDRNMRETVESLASEDNPSPDKVVDTVFMHLKNVSNKHGDEYTALIKMFRESESIALDFEEWEDARSGKLKQIHHGLIKEKVGALAGEISGQLNDKFYGYEYNEKEKNITIKLLYKFKELDFEHYDDETLKEHIDRLIKNVNSVDPLDEGAKPKVLPPEVYTLYNRLADYKLSTRDFRVQEIFEQLDDVKFARDTYPLEHKEGLASANAIIEEINEKSKEQGRSIVASFCNKELRESIDFDDLKQSVILSLRNSGESKEVSEEIYKDFVRNIRNSRRHYKDIWDVSNGDGYHLHSFSRHDNLNEKSNQILRDSMYLSLMKNKNTDVYDSILSGKEEEIIVDSINDVGIKKPNFKRVNNFFNHYLLLQKTSSGLMEKDDADKIIKSDLFKNASIFSEKDRESILDISSQVAKEVNIVQGRNKEKEGGREAISKEAFLDSVQELNLIGFAKEQTDKLKPKNFVGRLFGENAKALTSLLICSEKAKSPTTSVETVPSMTKACIDRYIEDLNKNADELEQSIEKSGAFAAFNPFAFLLIIQAMNARVNAVDSELEMLESFRKLNDETHYYDLSNNDSIAIARKLVVDAEYSDMSGTFVSTNKEDQLLAESEMESTVFTLMKNGKEEDVIDKERIPGFFKEVGIAVGAIELSKESHKTVSEYITKLGSYRDSLYKEIIEGEKEGRRASQTTLSEIGVVDKLLPSLHKRLLVSNESSLAIAEGICSEYGITLSEDIRNEILSKGLSSDSIRSIIQESDGKIGEEEKNKLAAELCEHQSAQFLMGSKDEINLENANIISRYIAATNQYNRESWKTISSSNNFHSFVIDSNSENGQSYVLAGGGINAYRVNEAERLIREGEHVEANKIIGNRAPVTHSVRSTIAQRSDSAGKSNERHTEETNIKNRSRAEMKI